MLRIVLASVLWLAAATGGSAMDSLSHYTWKNRVLVLFGEPDDPQMTRQLALLARQEKDLAERDMVVLQVAKSSVVPVFGTPPAATADRLRADLKASGSFELVLIGKDGGVKLRSKDAVPEADLFGLVDSMPMRRAGQR
jgi:hypothetical protein